MNHLDLDGEHALLKGQLEGLVAVFYENERPLGGLAGLMDWRSRGLISQSIRQGAATGKEGECVYVPLRGPEQTCHLLLIGGGQLSRYGKRGLISDSAFSTLRENLLRLKLTKIGVSKTEFGGLNEEYLETQLRDAPFWVVR